MAAADVGDPVSAAPAQVMRPLPLSSYIWRAPPLLPWAGVGVGLPDASAPLVSLCTVTSSTSSRQAVPSKALKPRGLACGPHEGEGASQHQQPHAVGGQQCPARRMFIWNCPLRCGEGVSTVNRREH